AEPGEALPYQVVKLVRAPAQRDELRERIARRFDVMLAAGFEAEVQRLLGRGDLAPDMPSLRSVGYRQMVGYLLGEYDRPTMVTRAVQATVQYAKRQMTWLRAEQGATWLPEDRVAALGSALKIVAPIAT
ncbi:MAG: tRNA (adenosine(37)-N6)-dimethylallyltransferase MiaA, partial [Acidobacteria bacterium]|nr:tRNA (adenosine(37)-N6)-dimethylallyltransferase MiaA [Acidobacteriota bacterium]